MRLPPVPVKGAVCGDPGAVLVTEMVAERLPATVGLKIALRLQFCPGCKTWFVAQVFTVPGIQSPGLAPAMVMLVSVTAILPLLVRVVD